MPDYTNQGSGEATDAHAVNCHKLALSEPYHGNNYSIIFKRKTSLSKVYYIITKMELTKLSDDNLTFDYYYSITKNNQITIGVGMNHNALQMVSTTNAQTI